MIRVRADAGTIVQRLRARAARIAVGYLKARRPRRRSDWHSATALWPHFTGDRRDGK